MPERQNSDAKKRILCVADVSIKSLIGGAERVLYAQSTGLVRRGHEVHIMTRLPSNQSERQEKIDGVQEWRYQIHQGNPMAYFRSTCRNSRRLFESLQRRHPFEVIIFQQPFSAAGVVRSALSRTARKLYVCHSLSYEEFISRNKKPQFWRGRFVYRLQIIFRRYLEKKILENSAQIIVLSHFTVAKLDRAYKLARQKYAIIPGGADLSRFYPAASKSAIRNKLGLPENKVILLTVRNLVARMGLENLIRALAQAVKEAPDLYLLIGGTGPLMEPLTALAKELDLTGQVRFAGFIPEEELADYYRMADLFVLPTKELEGFGLVTLEAMASGLPVVGTPVGGTREILGRFDPSFLFRDTTAASMTELILSKYCKIKGEPAAWQAIGTKCRCFVKANYSWEKHIDALEKLF